MVEANAAAVIDLEEGVGLPPVKAELPPAITSAATVSAVPSQPAADDDDEDEAEQPLTVRCGGYDLHGSYDATELNSKHRPKDDYIMVTFSICPNGWSPGDQADSDDEEGSHDDKSIVHDSLPHILSLLIPRGTGGKAEFEASIGHILAKKLKNTVQIPSVAEVPHTRDQYETGVKRIKRILVNNFSDVPDMPDDYLSRGGDHPEEEVNGEYVPKPRKVNNHSHDHEEDFMQTLTAAATQVGEYDEYEVYKTSFGLTLLKQREAHGMSPDELAVAATKVIRAGRSVSDKEIERWEMARAVPDQDQYNALVAVLIDDNKKLAEGEEKAEAKRLFKAAYERSKQWVGKTGPEADDHFEDQVAFRRLLMQHKEQLKLSSDKLAKQMQSKLRFEITPQEQEFLEQDKGTFISGIEAGKVHPSKHLMVVLVSALNATEQGLSESANQALYAAYADLVPAAAPVVAHVKRTRVAPHDNDNGTNGTVAAPDGTELAPLDPKVRALKDKLHNYFRDASGDFVAFTVIAEAMALKQPAGLSVLMGGKNNMNPASVLSDHIMNGLAKYLRENLQKPNEVDAFLADFQQMRVASGYNIDSNKRKRSPALDEPAAVDESTDPDSREPTTIPPEVQAQRRILRGFFTQKEVEGAEEKMVQLSNGQIGRLADIRENPIGSIMGEGTLDPKRFGGLTPDALDKLKALLVRLGKDEPTVAAFEAEFKKMRDLVGYVGRSGAAAAPVATL